MPAGRLCIPALTPRFRPMRKNCVMTSMTIVMARLMRVTRKADSLCRPPRCLRRGHDRINANIVCRSVNEPAEEVCDGLDNNCNGESTKMSKGPGSL